MVWTNQDYGRRVLSGAVDFSHRTGTLDIHLRPLMTGSETEAQTGRLDGLIAAVNADERHLVPEVDGPILWVPRVSSEHLRPSVSVDGHRAGRVAAEHLLSLRIGHVGFVGFSGPRWASAMKDGAMEAVGESDAVWLDGIDGVNVAEFDRWIASLPRPCGVVCQSDALAVKVVKSAHGAGLKVPDDIAVIGLGNDPIVCMLHQPSISSVIVPAERIGELAAEHIVQQVRGGSAESVRLAPAGVLRRDSTDTIAVDDPLVERAVRFVRSSFSRSLTTEDVAEHVRLSRRMLDYRFVQAMGCTVHDELVRCRLDRARSLLANTDESIKWVGISVGFMEAANFNHFIRQHTGMSPREYRRTHRQPPSSA